MQFIDLLTNLKFLLETKALQTSYEIGKEKAFSNEILIGIGNVESGGVILNNKIERKYISVSEHLLNQPDDEIVSWRTCLDYPEKPEMAKYYIEDLSADTC